MVTVIITLVFLWIAWTYLSDYRVAWREKKWRDEKVAMRRQVLARSPDSPAVLESLGDAMRERGDLSEAISCYEEALFMAGRMSVTGAGGLGDVAGGGLENKLRLTRMELAQERDPAAFNATLRTREQVCSRCGALALPFVTQCETCGAPLPVNSMFDTWRNNDMRKSLTFEALHAGASLTIISICLLYASTLEPLMKFTVLFSAVIAIAARLLKRVGPD
jgi:tetratricopeptide (TPR) repeat protein